MYDLNAHKSDKPWAVVRLVHPMQWVVISRYRSRADAEKNMRLCRQQVAEIKFEVVFDPPTDEGSLSNK
ncbi:MAG: hypothetical protein F6J89_16115 [Symploca sp. SIO1C4]|uniref:SPOR domain-containing protein n=1 Tax=Symploca sp. SIO1C4 TaxID=2607765 RepID=A0A6B3NEP8_9CYAN|nr:hypothetical protein [Symploca sp. SIO1C4]NET07691.1 hypothetical protein [Symploca sp. SIO2B6]NET52107.1 hypothetical protein [Merismopedia sp. SIO2A8]